MSLCDQHESVELQPKAPNPFLKNRKQKLPVIQWVCSPPCLLIKAQFRYEFRQIEWLFDDSLTGTYSELAEYSVEKL